MKKYFLYVLLVFLFFAGKSQAQNENALTRDEVASIKKKLVAVLDAIGQAPKGYVKEDEDFGLPTECYKNSSTGLYQPVYSSARVKFGGGAGKLQKSEKEWQQDYQKKIAEAQAKGDMETMMKLVQEMQKRAGESQAKMIEANKEPIDVTVTLNSGANQTIDPDAVVFEKAGVIALRFKQDETQEKIRIGVYFDPATLKDTKQLSKIELMMPDIKNKTSVVNAMVEFSGPAAEVEQWVKGIATAKILSQIDARSK